MGKRTLTGSPCKRHDYPYKKSKRNSRSLLELISYYSKFAGYKSNIEKSIAFLNTNSEQVDFEIENTTLFTLPPLKIKYLGKYNKIYTRSIWENCQTLIDKIKMNYIDGSRKDVPIMEHFIPCSRKRRQYCKDVSSFLCDL